MKKILLILENSPFQIGGIERHCRNIIDMFATDKDLTIDYLSTDRIKHSYNKLFQKTIWNDKELRDHISGYDVIHIHGFASYTVFQAIKASVELKKRIIYTPHYHPFNFLRRPIAGKVFFDFFLKPKLKYIDRIIAINNEDFSFFRSFNKNVTIIPNWLTGLDLVKAEKKPNMILAIGRNDENKALYHLNYIPFDKYEVHCVTKESIGLDPNIKIHSDIDDLKMSALYSQSSLVVIPSKYEAFSYVALEALERGVPILVSQNVRIVDHLQGISGFTCFEFNDKKDFISQLDLAVKQAVDQKKIVTQFSVDAIFIRLKQIYLE